jgi:hypothetical protein
VQLEEPAEGEFEEEGGGQVGGVGGVAGRTKSLPGALFKEGDQKTVPATMSAAQTPQVATRPKAPTSTMIICSPLAAQEKL